jgi:hypothetical protein
VVAVEVVRGEEEVDWEVKDAVAHAVARVEEHAVARKSLLNRIDMPVCSLRAAKKIY